MSATPSAALPRERVVALELLRGLAAVQVAFVHMLGFWGAFHAIMVRLGMEWVTTLFSGRVAVALFFILSGYVLQRSSFVHGHAVSSLFARYVRLALPVVAASLCVHALIAVGLFDFDQVRRSLESPQVLWDPIPRLPASLWNSLVTHFTTLVTPADEHRIINPPTWTISFEFVGSVLILVLSRIRQSARGLLAAILAIGFATAAYPYSELIFFPLAVVFVEFLEAPTRRVAEAPATARWLRPALVVVVLVGAVLEIYALVAMAIFVMFLTLGDQWPIGRFRRFSQTIGRMSYSVYLLHFPLYIVIMTVAVPEVSRERLLEMARSAPSDAGTALALLGAITAIFVSYAASVTTCALIFERFVDRPSMRLAGAIRKAGFWLRIPFQRSISPAAPRQ